MNAKQKQIAKYVGYAGFYLSSLLFFAYLTFPFDRLRTRIQSEFNASQTGPSPLSLRLGHLSSYWFSGVRADDVELISPASTAPSEDLAKPAKPKVMRIDTVHARVSLLRLLFGTMHVNFGARAFGGEALRHRASDSVARARDYHYLLLESLHAYARIDYTTC